MKIKILLPIVLFCFGVVYAQFGPQQIISTNAHLAFRVIPFDLDQDGHIDVISALPGSSKVVWHRNLDGQGNFGSEQIITSNALAILGLEIADLDTDGDIDILYRTNLDTIVWLENLDGLGTFGPERLVSQTGFPDTVSAADLDEDGDSDLLAIVNNSSGQQLVWYENTDGSGTFSAEIHIDTQEFWNPAQAITADIDNDGDLDIVSSYATFVNNTTKMVWYENLNNQSTFSQAKEIYDFESAISDWTHLVNITSSDFNGDGKIDLLVDTHHDESSDYIYWIENLNGLGSFSEPKFIHEKHNDLGSLRSYDLDGDGDNDILISLYSPNASIAWFRNTDGQGSFGHKRNISFQIDRGNDAVAVDLNSSGHLDVISASSGDDKIAWYENTGILNIQDNSISRYVLYPNPFEETISLNPSDSILSIELNNELGQTFETDYLNGKIDLSYLSSGLYFLKIIDQNGTSEVHKILKN